MDLAPIAAAWQPRLLGLLRNSVHRLFDQMEGGINDLKLKYRGRLDEGRTAPPPAGARRELVEAMRSIAARCWVPNGLYRASKP